MKLASCKSALNTSVVYSTKRSKAMVPVLVLLFVALWFILRGDLFYVLHCVILFLCFSVILALRLPRLGKRELILVFFVRLFDLCLFGFVGFLFLGIWKGLRFVIVALPGRFSYLLYYISFDIIKVLSREWSSENERLSHEYNHELNSASWGIGTLAPHGPK